MKKAKIDNIDTVKILVADDDAAGLLMASEALTSAGFEVIEANNGIEVVEQFEKHQPDLVIMDVVMPHTDSYETCARIRQSEGGTQVPILMMTNLDDGAAIQKSFEAGATDFVTKPTNFFLLPFKVSYLLRATESTEILTSQNQIDNVLRIAKLGHWQWMLDTDTVKWSTECQNILPSDALDEKLTNFLEAIHEDDRARVASVLEGARTDAKPFNFDFRTKDRNTIASNTIASNTKATDTKNNKNNKNNKKETTRIFHVKAEPESDTHMVGTIQDITERTNASEQTHNLAYYDLVTGLPNRAHLYDMLSFALNRGQEQSTKFAVLFLDLDHFKQVNDTLGHNAGDLLLRQVSSRLKHATRKTDGSNRTKDTGSSKELTEKIARLGGDEFVVLLDQVDRIEDAAYAAQRICKELAKSFNLDGNEARISTTIGISIYPTDGETAEELLEHADVAMYHAKEQGRNGYQFYSQSIHNLALERFALERDLRKALETDGFHLEYQPKIALKNGEVTGLEALLRWQHPERGNVIPADFIPLAEQTGLILPLGEWVLKTACKQMVKWLDEGIEPFIMAVNCSSIQLVRTDMASVIKDALESTGLDPAHLEIELTESLLVEDVEEGIKILQALKDLGLHVSIDDFGTGFSSMSYLKRLPIDKLKIDESFIQDLNTDPGDAAIVTSIITLAHNLDLSVIAEGVENAEQLGFLRAERCDEIQGYLICKPLSADAFAGWLQDRVLGGERKAA